MMKILTVVGARPQFIKAAVVSRVFAKNDCVKEIIVHTGQHFDENMSNVFFDEMSIPKPDYNLNINGLGHGAMTGQMLEKIEEILLYEKPDWVLVYGDTNSTLAGALAAKKLHIKLAHVEAGLRSFNMDMPEEINRILTDRISDVLFCPTEHAINNLKMEGYGNMRKQMICCGDVMQDAALFYSDKCKIVNKEIPEKFILCTIHRAENTDDTNRLMNILTALEEIATYSGVVLPLHPRTKSKLKDIGYDFSSTKICFIEPVGYLEMIYLLKNCDLVITDSGGLQKEAYFFNKYCITMRDETEWIELVNNGFNKLVGSDKDQIVKCYQEFISIPKKNFEKRMYGDGDAGEQILRKLMNYDG